MSETLIVGIITAFVALIAGGGGVFAFMNNRQKNKHEERSSAVIEWKQLYDEMKSRLDKQEQENNDLKNEIAVLKTNIHNLTVELSNYKKYDVYINELERYADHLLHTCQSVLTEDAYKNLCKKKPVKNIVD